MDDIFLKAAGADPLADELRRVTGAVDAGRRTVELAVGGLDPALASVRGLPGQDAVLASQTLRAAAGITLPSVADPLLTAGGADGAGFDELRRSAESAAERHRALELAAGGLGASSRLLAGHDPFLATATLRAAAGATMPHAADMLRIAGGTLPSATDMLRIAGVAGPLAVALASDASLQSMLSAAAEARRIHDELFRMPHRDELARLTEAASAGALARTAFGDDFSGLRAAMDAVRAPWLRDGALAQSALGFGELQAMGALLRREPPFSKTLSAALRLDLGDWRDEIMMPVASLRDAAERSRFYEGRGLNRALVDFTPRAFDESLAAAGLADAPAAPDENEDDEEAGLARARAAFERLQRFERDVRRFVDRVMREAFGEAWIKRRTPPGMRDEWVRKRDIAASRGEAERPLIDYADFTDYKAIIERGDNWQDVFRHVFGRQEDVRESFQRLFPVRICTMHARTVTLDDELFLVAETTRLLRAMKKAD